MVERTKMKPEYVMAWGAWVTAMVLAEIANVENPWFWAAMVLFFGVVEGIAVKRVKKGDTFSETIWEFQHGGWARIPLVVGFVGWLCFKLFTVAGGGIAAACLAGGLGIWLLIHFLFGGKHG